MAVLSAEAVVNEIRSLKVCCPVSVRNELVAKFVRCLESLCNSKALVGLCHCFGTVLPVVEVSCKENFRSARVSVEEGNLYVAVGKFFHSYVSKGTADAEQQEKGDESE